MAVPGPTSNLNRPLLAYDGSPKAEEALYIGAHISSMWEKPLVVVSVQEQGKAPRDALARAGRYLKDHGDRATLVEKHGQAASRILEAASEYACDLIIMGGYGFRPLVEIALGSVVDEVLRRSQIPVLVCR
jgi:nucleotide-binding universal stress UspA family protein